MRSLSDFCAAPRNETVQDHEMIRKQTALQALLAMLILGVTVASAGQSQPTSIKSPNFVIILADDLGYGDLSCYGATHVSTPNLDRLAAEGLRLTDFHSSGAVCSPTRAGLMTGRYQHRAGIEGVVYANPKNNRHHGLQPVQEFTLAEGLNAQGYRSAIFGKWHLGYETQYNPTRHGFDEFIGYVSGNVDYQSHVDQMGFEDWWQGADLTPQSGYVTELITDNAKAFLDRHPCDQPFLLYLAHETPHYPYQGPKDPATRQVGSPGATLGERKDRKGAYKEMIEFLDLEVGRTLEALREKGVMENTYVIFFSDNGATPLGSNGALRGAKGSLWEGGHRVPCIIWKPGVVPAGSTSDALTISMDITATVWDLAGATAHPQRPLDGSSLTELMRSPDQDFDAFQRRQLFWEHRGGLAMRDGDWKWLRTSNTGTGEGKGRLFHLGQDLGEKEDVSETEIERENRMRFAAESWLDDVRRGATLQPEKD
jgi:arylsulfatase A